jgi:hypothetical protein
MRRYDLHGPDCPTDCLINVEFEDIEEVLPDITKEPIGNLKVGEHMQCGPDDEWRIYRRKDK